MLSGDVKEPTRRHSVCPHRVDAVGGHEREIPVDILRLVILAAGFIRAERPVSHAPHIQFGIPDEDELAAHVRTGSRVSCHRLGRSRRSWCTIVSA